MAAGRGEDEDVAGVLLAHQGQGGLDEVDLRKEDGLELVADEVSGGGGGCELFDGADECLGGAAEEDVEAAEEVDGLGDGGGAVGGDAGVAADAADAVLPGVAVGAV